MAPEKLRLRSCLSCTGSCMQVCKFYMLNGFCAFGMNCRFNHPNICAASGPEAGVVIDTGSAFED